MEERLNQQVFIDLLIEKHGLERKQSEKFIKEFFLLIEDSLKHDKLVKIKGLGTFKLIDVDSRESININTGERFVIEGYTKISFTPESALRELINKPFAHFETVALNENTVLEDTIIEKEESENIVNTENSNIYNQDTPQINEDIINNDITEVITEPSIINSTDSETSNSNDENHNISFKDNITPEADNSLESKYDLNDPDDIVEDTSSTVSSRCMKYIIITIIIALLFCGGVVFYIYNPNIIQTEISLNERFAIITGEEAIKQVSNSNVIIDDVVVINELDTIKETPIVVAEPQATVNDAKVTKVDGTDPDSLSYIIKGTQTTYMVKQGETLTKISLRFYGTKNLWPYIVKHNKDIIKQPNNVPYGTLLKIPELARKQ